MLEGIIAGVVIICFLLFATKVVGALFQAEIEELRAKDKRYWFRRYRYHSNKAKKAYNKYQSLKRDGGDNIKSRRRKHE